MNLLGNLALTRLEVFSGGRFSDFVLKVSA
jgi:hypothetical protein